jgi:hypothetical protein
MGGFVVVVDDIVIPVGVEGTGAVGTVGVFIADIVVPDGVSATGSVGDVT